MTAVDPRPLTGEPVSWTCSTPAGTRRASAGTCSPTPRGSPSGSRPTAWTGGSPPTPPPCATPSPPGTRSPRSSTAPATPPPPPASTPSSATAASGPRSPPRAPARGRVRRPGVGAGLDRRPRLPRPAAHRARPDPGLRPRGVHPALLRHLAERHPPLVLDGGLRQPRQGLPALRPHQGGVTPRLGPFHPCGTSGALAGFRHRAHLLPVNSPKTLSFAKAERSSGTDIRTSPSQTGMHMATPRPRAP